MTNTGSALAALLVSASKAFVAWSDRCSIMAAGTALATLAVMAASAG